MSYLDDAAAQVEVFEGKVPWLYRDMRGNVTCGVGKMLANMEAALALPFYTAEGKPATAAQIESDWKRVMGMPFSAKYAAAYYRCANSLMLEDEDIDSMLVEVLRTCDGELATEFAAYAEFPACVKMALLDMDYNLGSTKLRTTYPKFNAAVNAKDWLTAAAECQRQGISEERNAWTAGQLKQALGGEPAANAIG